MSAENIPISDLIASLKMYLGYINSSKSKAELNNQSEPSTSKNIPITDLVASLKMYFEYINFSKSKKKLCNQSEPSTSTSKTISALTPTSNAIQKFTEILRNKTFLDAIESIDLFIELCFYEQNKSKSSLLDIKEACEAFSNEFFTCLIPNKELVATLKSRISHYWQLCTKEMINPNTLEETLDILLSYINRISSEDKHTVDALKRLKASTEQIIVRKNELKSICKEIHTLLDAMLRQLSRHRVH